MEDFEQWARAHDVAPLNSPKRVCELLGCGHDFFYQLVKDKKLKIKKLGAKSVVTSANIYEMVCKLPEADQAA